MATFIGTAANETIRPGFVSGSVLRFPAGSFPGAGVDLINGGAGADFMEGGGGNDTYIVDNFFDTTVEAIGGGIDTVQSSITRTLSANVENLTLTGVAAISGTGNIENNVITGNGAANLLSGLAGNDRLLGGAGNDTLLGGDGNDTVDGGTGADNLNGGFGNDVYIVDNIGDIAGEVAGGIDTVLSSVTHTLSVNMENLTLTGAAAINGGGNASANVINGNGANNSLAGGAGNDTLNGNSGNDTLNGGTGADKMNGGLGNDLYIVDNIGDIAAEVAGGTDTVQSSVSHALSVNMENLTLTGGAAINGTGNANNNVINGNVASNTLSGGTGNDTLNGGSGNDVLIGGVGRDVLIGGLGLDRFDFNFVSESLPGATRDIIADFLGAGFGLGDAIDLSTIDANPFLAGNQAFLFIGAAPFFGVGQVRFIAGVLQANTDLDAIAELEIQVNGVFALAVGGAGTDIIL